MIVGVDVGGSNVHGVILSSQGSGIAEATRDTPRGPEQIFAAMCEVIDELLAAAQPDARDAVVAIGVGTPGTVDVRSGVVENAVNLAVSDPWALAQLLRDRYGVPAHVDNDVKATARGAMAWLASEHVSSLVYVNVGTGVACACVANGEIVRGADNIAGEIGHIPVDPAGAACACGQVGCLETVIGGGAIMARLAGQAQSISDLFAPDAEGKTALETERARILTGIALAVELVTLTYGADRVVLGGGVISRIPDVIGRVSEILRTRAAHSGLLTSLRLHERVRLAPAGIALAAIGAALTAAPRGLYVKRCNSDQGGTR